MHVICDISPFPELKHSLLCLETSYATIENIRDIILGRLEAFVSVACGIRTMGSAALTLCHVAMGAVEGYHSDNLMPWDVAAGVLIVKEAGGVIIDTNGIILYILPIISLILIRVIYSYFRTKNLFCLNFPIRWKLQRYVTKAASCR